MCFQRGMSKRARSTPKLEKNTFPIQSIIYGWEAVSGGGGVGPDIVDFGPRPGPIRPRGGLGKAAVGAPLDAHRVSAR